MNDDALHVEALHLLEHVRGAGEGMVGADAARWLDTIARKHDRVDAALHYFVARGRGAEAVTLMAEVWRYWLTRGDTREGREWLASALTASGADTPSGARARALYGAGLLAFRQDDNETARRLNEESLAVARAVGDRTATVEALGGLARVALREGDYVAARTRCEDGLALARAGGKRGAEVLPLHLLAAITRIEGDYDGARRLYLASVQLNKALGDARMVAMEHVNLGSVEVLAGNPEGAEPHLRDGLRAVRALGAQGILAVCLIGLACVAAARGDVARAARLLGATEADLARTETALDPDDQPLYDAAVVQARAAMGEEAFAAARAAGRELALEAAAAYALDEGP